MRSQHEPRKLSPTRATRYQTRNQLRDAVLEWCRNYVRQEDPTFDLAKFEADLADRIRRWGGVNSDAFRRWTAMRDTLLDAHEYLRANPKAPEQSVFAALLESFLSSPCRGNDG